MNSIDTTNWTREDIENINSRFKTINICKWQIRDGEKAREEYPKVLAKLLAVITAGEGEELSQKALDLLEAIDRGDKARQTLWQTEAELRKDYGITIGAKPVKEAV